jgi:hypothetical protein
MIHQEIPVAFPEAARQPVPMFKKKGIVTGFFPDKIVIFLSVSRSSEFLPAFPGSVV